MHIFIESQPTGTISSIEPLTADEREEILNSQIRFYHDEATLTEYAESGEFTEEELKNERENGGTDDLIERDSDAQITKMTTTDGVWFIIAQEQDGHGVLMMVKEE